MDKKELIRQILNSNLTENTKVEMLMLLIETKEVQYIPIYPNYPNQPIYPTYPYYTTCDYTIHQQK